MFNLRLLLIYICLCSFNKMELANINEKGIKSLAASKINVIAISSATSIDVLNKLKQLKLQLNIPENLINPQAQIFVANSDSERLKFLKEAFYDEKRDVIWALRGGYGAARLIPHLFNLKKPGQEKILIGYSDTTALHLFLSQEWGWKTIHGIVLKDLLYQRIDTSDITKINQIIKGEVKEIMLNDLIALNELAHKSTSIEGLLTGGNLTIIQTSIGTKWQIKSQNKILFIEDANMEGYQVERALVHLLHAEVFKDVKAVIFGDFNEQDTITSKAIALFAKKNLDIPAYRSFKFGHGKINQPLIYNARSKITPTNPNNAIFVLTMEVK